MLRHFPAVDGHYIHNKRDYYIAGFTFFSVAVCLFTDADAGIEKQNALGVIAWVFLIGLLLGECKFVRMQVLIAVAFATMGEHFASVYMEGYIYRYSNVPAYVPPGHGMVYLTAVALARSGFFQQHARIIAHYVLLICGLWTLWGIGLAERGDVVGAILFFVFLIFLFRGRSPLVYLAAFFITTWLEIIGTALETWQWVVFEPIFGLPQGNPPSAVAAWYCLVDAVALGGAAPLLNGMTKVLNFCKLLKRKTVFQTAENEDF
jgi:hypothetical protein